jgi:hypothetical protein
MSRLRNLKFMNVAEFGEACNGPNISGVNSFITNYFNNFQFFIISATMQNEMKAILQMKKLDSYLIKLLGSQAKKGNNIQ